MMIEDSMENGAGSFTNTGSGRQDVFHSGYATIVGPPNVGKSTLLNALLGQKLAITTPKPQTTRHRIMGVVTGDRCQIIFFDTPGLFHPSYELQSAMVRTAREAMKEADVLLYVIDAAKKDMQCDGKIMAELKRTGRPVLLVINKVDLVAKRLLLPIIAQYRQVFPFSDYFPVSALHRDGLDDLMAALVLSLPEGGPLYEADMLTDRSERYFASELIREAIFHEFQEEIPYSTSVAVTEFKRRGKVYVQAEITVERMSQKAIIIGQRGEALRRIGQIARKKIEELVDAPVYLDLWIKVRPGWRCNARDVKELEYRQER